MDLVRIVSFALLLGCAAHLPAQTARPNRQVVGSVITSEHDPAVRIQLPKSVHYAGGDRWVLYGIADCELHAFVETAGENVQRLYWVQFEGYLPSRPELHHTYNSPKHATLGGMDFYVDTWIRRTDEKSEQGSDLEHILRLVEADGNLMPNALMYVRLVHLLDQQNRKELMIIYAEDLAPTGFTPSQMSEGGSAHDKWPSIGDGLLHRAEKLITLTTLR